MERRLPVLSRARYNVSAQLDDAKELASWRSRGGEARAIQPNRSEADALPGSSTASGNAFRSFAVNSQG